MGKFTQSPIAWQNNNKDNLKNAEIFASILSVYLCLRHSWFIPTVLGWLSSVFFLNLSFFFSGNMSVLPLSLRHKRHYIFNNLLCNWQTLSGQLYNFEQMYSSYNPPQNHHIRHFHDPQKTPIPFSLESVLLDKCVVYETGVVILLLSVGHQWLQL